MRAFTRRTALSIRAFRRQFIIVKSPRLIIILFSRTTKRFHSITQPRVFLISLLFFDNTAQSKRLIRFFTKLTFSKGREISYPSLLNKLQPHTRGLIFAYKSTLRGKHTSFSAWEKILYAIVINLCINYTNWKGWGEFAWGTSRTLIASVSHTFRRKLPESLAESSTSLQKLYSRISVHFWSCFMSRETVDVKFPWWKRFEGFYVTVLYVNRYKILW